MAIQRCRCRPGLALRCAIAHRGTHTPRPALLEKTDHDQHAKQLLPVVMGPCVRRDDVDMGRYGVTFPRRNAPELYMSFRALENRGRGECRMRAAPAVSCANSAKKAAHEHTGQRRASDIPCAVALRLITRSPR
jgi:hypothetical protein